jgi:hypothetical protein
MMSDSINTKNNNGNRKCIFKKTVCTFHGFFQRSIIMRPSLMIGGDDGGVLAYPVAIIETEKGEVIEAQAVSIQFMGDEE